MTRETARRLEGWLVFLIAVHSYGVALFLMFFTEWGLEFGGWGQVSVLFFARQAGIFHAVVATGYLVEFIRYRGVALLLIAKSCAVVFLTAMLLIDGGPWALPLSAVGDAVMGILAWWLHRQAAWDSGEIGR